MRTAALGILAAIAAGLGACQGSPPAPPQPPASPPKAPGQDGNAPNTAPPIAAVPTPTPSAQGGLAQHGSGLISLVMPGVSREICAVQAFVRAGSNDASPGVAELAADAIVAGGDASTGRRSLRETTSQLGGLLDVDVGPSGIWITLRLPASQWQAGTTALLAALREPVESRTQIERLRDDHIDARSRVVWNTPEAAAAHALLLGDPGTDAYVANLLDRDASDVRQFLALHCAPGRTVLTVESAIDPATLRKELNDVVTAAKWRPLPGATPATTPPPRAPLQGVFWAKTAGTGSNSTSLVLALPNTEGAAAADAMVLMACLTLDGVGGRLEQRLRQRGLGHLQLQPRWQHAGTASALVLSTHCTATEARVLWQVLGEVRASLRAVLPNASELQLGLRRATLSTRLLTASDAARLRSRVDQVLRPSDSPSAAQRLQTLQQTAGQGVAAAIDAFLELPTAMIVFGGTPPVELATVREFSLLPPGALAKLVGAPPAAQAASGKPWLAPSLEALGGADVLRRTVGFRAASTQRIGNEPALTETLEWRLPSDVTRIREVLGQKIETTIQGAAASELLGKQRVALDSVETRRILRELARHPIALMAAHARGELDFRPIAQRDVGDREILVLEAIGSDFDRLRIHVDVISRLLRVVEVWETVESGLHVHVQESWSDYRSCGGLRVPHRRITELDDGSTRTDAVYASFEPLFRGP